MKMISSAPQCNVCGRFVSVKDSQKENPSAMILDNGPLDGGSNDERDCEIVHIYCFFKENENGR
jgi:hypothetical protein